MCSEEASASNYSAVKKFVTNFRLLLSELVEKYTFSIGNSVEKCQLSTRTNCSNSSSEKNEFVTNVDQKVIIAKTA